jgi:hypothetical protein
MSTAPDSPRRRNAHESSDANALVEVFSRFTLDSGRRSRHRRSASAPADGDEGARQAHETGWPVEEPSDVEPSEWSAPEPGDQVSLSHPLRSEEESAATYIRPYAWTGGRTRSNHQFELETLVSTSELCRTGRLDRVEHHCIADLCRHPRSVAEVGAVLGVPLGVARVLLGDMADLGLITVHRTVSDSGSTSHLMLMERVLSGLRRL